MISEDRVLVGRKTPQAGAVGPIYGAQVPAEAIPKSEIRPLRKLEPNPSYSVDESGTQVLLSPLVGLSGCVSLIGLQL